MLKEFIEFNKDKYLLMLKWTSAIFTILTISGFAVGFFYGYRPKYELFLAILFSISIFFPIFTITIGTLKEFQTYRKSRMALSKYPFNELTKHGFSEIYTHKDSKWNYTQFGLIGELDSYSMICHVNNSVVYIMILTNMAKIRREHRKKISAEFGRWKIEYHWHGITIPYRTSNKKNISSNEVLNDITRLVELLKREGLTAGY
ncbi:hypothetical protein [Fibrella aquatilis]|uniref:Uncharacterized protein n=1 Tax=Fibrella aquatilis TaxID=2817059 RepID=A0A939G7U3_9BACT|nr:hypothetical protein [Fibrella aquatilis]MBO0931368.1 hypothetical protein [Fibrella aquatilis]